MPRLPERPVLAPALVANPALPNPLGLPRTTLASGRFAENQAACPPWASPPCRLHQSQAQPRPSLRDLSHTAPRAGIQSRVGCG